MTGMQPTSSIHWNAYPALLAAVCIGVGIVGAERLFVGLYVWAAAGCVSACFAVAVIRPAALVGGERSRLLLCTLVCLVAVGAVRQSDYVQPGGRDVSVLPPGTELDLFGRPTAATATASGVRFNFHVDSVRSGGVPRSLVGRVQVYLRGGNIRDVDPCRRMHISGRLEDLPARRNPGEFDYGAYLRGRRVFARVFADQGRSFDRSPTVSTDPFCVAHRLKTRIERGFERSVDDPDARAVILALVVGDRSGIDGEMEVRFRRAGLLHLLAVSGLHVLIVGMILYHLLRPILLRFGLSWRAAEWVRTLVTGSVLAIYALVTGLPASVVRAVVMAILFMFGTLFQRSAHSLNTLGTSAIVLLLVRPAQLFEPGFQLSVGAVAAIISLQKRFAALFPSDKAEGVLLRSIRSSATVSFAASAGTLPVLLYHFGSVSFAGLFLNTLAVPLTSATLASSVTTAGAAGISAALGDTFAVASQFFARVLLYVVERGEPYFRWAYVEWSVDDPAVIAALVTILFAIAQWPRPRNRWRLLAAALAIICAAVTVDAAQGGWKPRMSAIFLDVGQGDAALFLLPGGRSMLVDAGPRSAYSDAGLYTILPQLRMRRIRAIDTIVITHPDSDHLGGLPTLLRHVDVGRVLHCGLEHDSDLYAETMHLLDSLEVPYRAVRAGDTLNVDPSIRIQILHPDEHQPRDRPNASSIVMRLQYGRTAFLMMGDAEMAAEREIVRRYGGLLNTDVIKVGHHGSNTSSSPLLTSRVRRRDLLAVVSVGRRNRYGLPDSSVVRRLAAAGAQIKRTDQVGAVWLESDGRRVFARRWR